MRILIIHQYYQDPGGEDLVFEQEVDMLSQSHDVRTFVGKNQRGWRGLLQKLLLPWNFRESRRLKRVLDQFQPQIVHIHNLHYGMGPKIIRTVHSRRLPIVMTVHNYRLLCPSATLFHENRIFLDSINAKFPWNAIKKGVYNGSVVHTFWLALAHYIHDKMGTWQMVGRYLVLTPFAKNLFCRSNFPVPAHKILIKPNFVVPASTKPGAKAEGHFLFVGRLDKAKGIELLLEVFGSANYEVKIAGSGPLETEVRQASRIHANINYLGALSKEEVRLQMAECSALVFPSLWFEGMPMTVIEAFEAGVPVIASKLGALENMVTPMDNGLLFKHGDSNDFKNQLQKWVELDSGTKNLMRKKAREAYEKHYLPEENIQKLVEIYHSLNNSVFLPENEHNPG